MTKIRISADKDSALKKPEGLDKFQEIAWEIIFERNRYIVFTVGRNCSPDDGCYLVLDGTSKLEDALIFRGEDSFLDWLRECGKEFEGY